MHSTSIIQLLYKNTPQKNYKFHDRIYYANTPKMLMGIPRIGVQFYIQFMHHNSWISTLPINL
jgi:hypothetical protein